MSDDDALLAGIARRLLTEPDEVYAYTRGGGYLVVDGGVSLTDEELAAVNRLGTVPGAPE
jgi:hypothetical protein